MRDTLLSIHILAAGAWFGTNVMGFLVNPRINPSARAIATDNWHHTVVSIKQRYLYASPTDCPSLLEVDDSPFTMSDTFVLIGFLALGVAVLDLFRAPGRGWALPTICSVDRRGSPCGRSDMAVIVVAMVAMVGMTDPIQKERLNMAITGLHTILYSSEVDAFRAMLRDAFEFPHQDDGDGWMMFHCPPATMEPHPGPMFRPLVCQPTR